MKKPTFSLTIPPRDEKGFQALADLRERGVDIVANATAESADHILNYFIALRTELGFYLGALNLYHRLTKQGCCVCIPEPHDAGSLQLSAHELYDPCLALRLQTEVTGNDITADDTPLVVVTGANQGGKSTILRGVGLAHLLMQSGIFAPASSFRAAVTHGVFTHYKRGEDETMTSGKFDEELSRMSRLADTMSPHSLLLCNESFAATNEREGSEIAFEVIRALNDAGIRVVLVTHMYDLAHRFEDGSAGSTLFLRAERDEAGRRTFRLLEGAPQRTSFGEDLYRATFGAT
jgi:DNA mismatch repair ATPase MutS